MANDLNLCQFIGRLGQDPETRYTPSGDAVTTFSIAVGERWKDKDSGEKKEKTEWVRCVAWRGLADIAGQYLKKGGQCYVAGKFKTRKWQKDGQDHYTTEIQVEQLQLLGSAQRNGPPPPGEDDAPRTGKTAARTTQSAPPDMDDDIPFANPYRGRICLVI